MAISHTEARALALREIAACVGPEVGDAVVILDEHTLEKPYGWVFFYNSREFVANGNPLQGLAGNAPLIVNSTTREVVTTGTAYPLEHYLAEYERALVGLERSL